MPRPNTKKIANVTLTAEELKTIPLAKPVKTITISIHPDVYIFCKENRINISGTLNFLIGKIQKKAAAANA